MSARRFPAALPLLVLLGACSGDTGGDDGFANPGKLPPPANNGPTELLADLTVDEPLLASSLQFATVDPADVGCAVIEGCLVGDQGPRDVVRFDVGVVNLGEADLVIGSPTAPENAGLFEFSSCHNHYHYIGFAEYTLSDQNGEVASGHKQAFCLMDIADYGGNGDTNRGYNCSLQGISMGWEDIYSRDLDCQWIDVTGLPAGPYTLTVTVNALGNIAEAGPAPNTVSIPITLP